jgi:hypothetical protein
VIRGGRGLQTSPPTAPIHIKVPWFHDAADFKGVGHNVSYYDNLIRSFVSRWHEVPGADMNTGFPQPGEGP